MAGYPQRHGYSPICISHWQKRRKSAPRCVTDFVAALKAAYPQHSIVGHRQVQKSVNYLKNLLPNRKQYGKDEPEHCFAIDIIKTEVLLLATETAD